MTARLWDRARHRLGVALGALFALALPASAGVCARMAHDGQNYIVCTVTAEQEPDLRLWLDDAQGRIYGGLEAVRRSLNGEVLAFAMNAGMFHADYRPVGLYIADGREAGRLVTAAGAGNFGMLPNGVFCSGGARPFAVIESRAYADTQPECRLATQSGPMLVIDGALHPRFLVDATSRYVRNGVGVSDDGQTAWFAISERPVTFYQFGRLFRDGLSARDALYFDGSLSQIMAPEVGRADRGRRLGPIIGLVTPG